MYSIKLLGMNGKTNFWLKYVLSYSYQQKKAHCDFVALKLSLFFPSARYPAHTDIKCFFHIGEHWAEKKEKGM